MRNIEEILDTAFIKMMISDRGLLEKESHEGGSYSIKDREERRLLFVDILKSRNLYDKISQNEAEIFNSKVETLSEDTFYLTQMQYEAIPILLWAVGLSDFPKYDGKLCEIDFHPILGKYKTDQTKIGQQNKYFDYKRISWWRIVVLLWHWRSREGVSNPTIKNKDIIESIIQIFGNDYKKYFVNIPVSKKRPRDFIVNEKKFNELNAEAGKILLIQSKWRHHALEWISSDVTWEEIDTST